MWPEHFTRIDRKYPFGFWRWSTCEKGTCWNCLARRCDLCVHRQQGGPHVDRNADWVYSSRGWGSRSTFRGPTAPCACGGAGARAPRPAPPPTVPREAAGGGRPRASWRPARRRPRRGRTRTPRRSRSHTPCSDRASGATRSRISSGPAGRSSVGIPPGRVVQPPRALNRPVTEPVTIVIAPTTHTTRSTA
ncbi:DUF6248 family natural product biosynthesis protein [Streptomyces californicus]|uniref:DUF6248 family natural product biosynthesis protein n=1 Tax=Streptomyces californicus TaxID=67351 RepID=UPI0036F813EE